MYAVLYPLVRQRYHGDNNILVASVLHWRHDTIGVVVHHATAQFGVKDTVLLLAAQVAEAIQCRGMHNRLADSIQVRFMVLGPACALMVVLCVMLLQLSSATALLTY